MNKALLQKIEEFYKKAGLLKYPEELTDDITEWAKTVFSNLYSEELLFSEDQELIQEVKKYVGPESKQKLFKINLKNEVKFVLCEFNTTEKSINYAIYSPYITSTEIPKILCKITFYYQTIKEDELDVYNYNKSLNTIKYMVIHEIRHLVQDLLIGGYPSKKIQNNQDNKLQKDLTEEEYFLLDEEFYTLLGDAVNMFNDNFSKYPDEIKKFIAQYIVEGNENLTKQEFAINLSKIMKIYFPKTYVQHLELALQNIKYILKFDIFKVFKEKNIGKYKKAVKEFYKGIGL